MTVSGCMETLQRAQPPVARPPSPLPSPLSTRTVPGVLPSPSAPGSLAPDPATAAPTASPVPVAPSPSPLPSLPPLVLPTAPALTNEERWRAQQQDRIVFGDLQPYYSAGSELWWFDPVNQTHVILGQITGDFVAQAQFVVRGQGVPALEVPYQLNRSYGLTALSPALLERIAAAGYASDWIETYVFLTPDVVPR